MRPARILAYGVLALPVWTTGGQAETTDSYRLGEILVTTTADAVLPGRTTYSVASRDLELRSARSLDEAFGTVPAVNVSSGGGGIPRIFLRGLPQRHAPLFLNGVPLNSAADGQFDPRLIPVENIAAINIATGASSVLYGPGTTAGLINIITRQGQEGMRGKVQFEATSGDPVGRGTSTVTSGSVSGGWDNTSVFASGSHADSPGFVTAAGTLRPNSDTERTNLFANISHTAGAWQAGISGGYVEGQNGIPYTVVNDPTNPFLMPQIFERLKDISGGFAQIDLSYAPAEQLRVRLSGYANRLDLVDERFDTAALATMNDPTVQTFRQKLRSIVSGARTEASSAFGAFGTLATSIAVQREKQRLSGFIRNVPVTGGGGAGGGGGRPGGGGGGGQQSFANRALDSNDAQTTTSAAVEYSVTPVRRLHVTVGTSAHWFSRGGRTDRATQWMAGLTYVLPGGVAFNAAYARKIRFPTLQQLFDAQRGNPGLRPETSDDYEAGVTWSREGMDLTATLFRNRIAGFIQNDSVTQRFTNRDTLTEGVELSGRARLTPWATLSAGYTHLNVTDRATGTRVNFRPRDVVGLEAVVVPVPHWELYASVSAEGGQVVTARFGPAQQRTLPDRTLVGTRLAYSLADRGFRIWLRADNLFDRAYELAPGFPAAGRTFGLGTSLAF
jgi:outer membrane cobalamin receptor